MFPNFLEIRINPSEFALLVDNLQEATNNLDTPGEGKIINKVTFAEDLQVHAKPTPISLFKYISRF